MLAKKLLGSGPVDHFARTTSRLRRSYLATSLGDLNGRIANRPLPRGARRVERSDAVVRLILRDPLYYQLQDWNGGARKRFPCFGWTAGGTEETIRLLLPQQELHGGQH